MRYLLIFCILFCGCPIKNDPVPVTIIPNVIVPDNAASVSELTKFKDLELSEFYAEFADVVRRDSEIIKTTADIREAHVKAGKLMFQKRRVTNPELAAAVNATMATGLGLDIVELTDEKRREVIKLLEAMSWALQT